MQKHLEEVLTATGLPADQVKALVDLPDDAKDFKVDPYTTAIHTTVETKVKNDPKFYETIDRKNLPESFVKVLEQEQYGRAASIVRGNMLKAVGLKEDDFKDLGEEGKKIEIFTPAFVKKLSEGKVTDKELQQKLIEANTELQELKTGLPALEEKYKSQYEKQSADDKFDFIVLANLATVQGLKAPAKYISDKVAAQLKSQYDFVVAGTDAELRQKGKDLKVLIDNGTKELTLQGAINLILEKDGLVEKKAGSSTEKGSTTIDVNPEGGLKVSKNVNDKMNKRIAEDQKLEGGSK